MPIYGKMEEKMSFGLKYNTVLKRAEEGFPLWEICKKPGTPSYPAVMSRMARNTDGIREAYAEAVLKSGRSDGKI